MEDEIDRILLENALAISLMSADLATGNGGLIVVPDTIHTDVLSRLRARWDDCRIVSESTLLSEQDVCAASESCWSFVAGVDILDWSQDMLVAITALERQVPDNSALLLVQPNRALRRGVVPKSAGGPERCLGFYEMRSLVQRLLPGAHLAAIELDGGLKLTPIRSLPGNVAMPNVSGAAGFALITGGGKSYSATLMEADDRLPAQTKSLQLVSPGIAAGERRSLAFVIDVPAWAFDNIVTHIAPALELRYDVTRFYLSEYSDNSELVLDLFVRNSFDNIQFMWREFLFNTHLTPNFVGKALRESGLTPDEFAARMSEPVITTTVYDHLFLTDPEIDQRQRSFALVDGYSVASGILRGIYETRFVLPPCIETPDGVNTSFFHSDSPKQLDVEQFRIGWVGNSNWGVSKPGVGDDPKGLHSILVPAVEQLKAEGYDVVLELADKNLRNRDRQQMREYYHNEIDVLICASAFEGTPNPVLEAVASGCPFISTDVGIVREVSGPAQAEFILAERSVEAMANALRELVGNSEKRRILANENLQVAASIDWTSRVDSWTQLFAHAEKVHAQGKRLIRRDFLATRLQLLNARDRLFENSKPAARSNEVNKLRQRLIAVRDTADRHRNAVAEQKEINARLTTRLSELTAALKMEVERPAPEPTADQNEAYVQLQEKYRNLMDSHSMLAAQVGELQAILENSKPTRSDQDLVLAREEAEQRIADLTEWADEMQREIFLKDKWNLELQARVDELEIWTKDLQSLLASPRRSLFNSLRKKVRGRP